MTMSLNAKPAVHAAVAPAPSAGWITRRQLTLAAVLLLAASWAFLSDFSVTLLSYVGLYALVAVGLVMLTGVAGMTSFGQAAFVGVGAYATAWACTSPQAAAWLAWLPPAWLPWAGLALGLVLAAAVAWVLGAITLKLAGHYLPLCTIAWGLSLYFLFGNLELLGGHTGITGLPALSIGGAALATPRALGPLIWAVLLLSLWALHNLLDSREGRAIRTLKSGRVMAESMGVDTGRYRIKVFVLAALLGAVSGWLYAHLQRFVNPTPFNLNIGIEYLFMAVVGGAGHLWGAVLGAALITLLKEQLQDWLPRLLGSSGNFEVIVFGLLMLVVLQRYADGLWPRLAQWSGRWLKADPAEHLPAAAAPLAQRTLPPRGQVVLQAHEVTKRFGGLVANNAVNMSVKAGEVHALIGPNGAGKSTFFNMISGVDDPTTGEVRLMGKPMTGKPSREFAALGLSRSFQHVRLLGQRTVLENVAVGAHRRAHRGWVASMLRLDRAEEAAVLAEARRQIERCGLGAHADAPAASLALGQQRIVEIARALASQPAVLLLDEPAAGLRHLEKQALARLLEQLRAEGLGILVVEHDMEFVMNLADRITVLEFGTVIAEGTPAQIQGNQRVLDAYLGGSDDLGAAA
nr:branched-chain amino acid ABC transporter ATP-binding protein/permease [Azohydromonas lata]